MHFGCIFAMACHILPRVLCFVDGNDAFPFLGDPADYFELFLALDSIFGAILSLGFEFWCHSAILSRWFEFLHHFQHRVRVFVQFFTIAVTGFEFLCNSDQMVRILGCPRAVYFQAI